MVMRRLFRLLVAGKGRLARIRYSLGVVPGLLAEERRLSPHFAEIGRNHVELKRATATTKTIKRLRLQGAQARRVREARPRNRHRTTHDSAEPMRGSRQARGDRKSHRGRSVASSPHLHLRDW
jgi:hypothetical protein